MLQDIVDKIKDWNKERKRNICSRKGHVTEPIQPHEQNSNDIQIWKECERCGEEICVTRGP